MNIAQETSDYREERRPSDDASNVGRWIIGTSTLAFFLGFAAFAGFSGAADLGFMRSFAFGLGGGGFIGFLVMSLRIATYDKKPYVLIKEKTTTPVRFDEQESKRETLTGNAAPLVPSSTIKHPVSFRDKRYEFSPTQLRLMIDRIEEGNMVIARDYLGIETSMYSDVCSIMAGLIYWQVTRSNGRVTSARWKDGGIEWLESRMRDIPPTG